METYARLSLRATTRNDIDETKFLPIERIPVKGVKYFDAYDWEFSVKTKGKVRRILKKMMKKSKKR